MGYVFDVYRGALAPTRHAGHYALFVGFFPQLLAGPIQRAPHLLPQIAQGTRLDYAMFRSGLVLAVWGVFKKICIGDLAAPLIKRVYDQPQDCSNGSLLLLATVLFSVRVYCDFSGYTDTAIGVARMLGYDLTLNFRQPYFAPSVTEFWRRWHIGLTSWFRDYVYIPLGGNRVGAGRWAVNVLIVFVLSGLWHGAAWTFVGWGLIHGLWMMVERAAAAVGGRSRALVAAATSRLGVLGRVAITYLVVLAAWVLFNAHSFQDAWYILTHVWRLGPLKYDSFGQLGLPDIGVAVLVLNVAVLLTVDAVLWFKPPRVLAAWDRRWWLRALGYQALLLAIVFFGVFKKIEPIYFQF